MVAPSKSSNNKLFEIGILKNVKSNYSLMPIVFIGTFGLCLATAAVTRTLMKSPDIAINKTSEKKPYERYLEEDGRHVQYKLFTTLDYNRMKPDHDRPKL